LLIPLLKFLITLPLAHKLFFSENFIYIGQFSWAQCKKTNGVFLNTVLFLSCVANGNYKLFADMINKLTLNVTLMGDNHITAAK